MNVEALLPIGFAILCAAFGLLWFEVRSLRTDVKALIAHEERLKTAEGEIKMLRARWHDLRGEVSHTLAEWYNNLIERFSK